jgi:protein O-GlcNAc transferase
MPILEFMNSCCGITFMREFSLFVCLCTAIFASSLPVDRVDLFASAVQLHSAGNLNAAIEKMSICCHQGGDLAAQACFNTAVYLSESQNFVESSKFFRMSIEQNGRNALAYSNLGVTYQYLGDFAAALGCYESSLKLNPRDATTYFNIGKVNQELGRTMDAIRSFEHSVRIKPDYFEAYATLGGAFTPLRDWERSSSLLRDALKLQPDSVEGLYLLLYAEMQMCSWSQTTQLMQRIRPLIAQRLISHERPGMEAYASLTMPWTLLEQTRISASFSRAAARNVQHLPPLPLHDTITSKLRVVFKSYDFADHMSLYLIIEAMEMLAARQDIVSFAFNVRNDDGSDLVRRLRVAFAERYECVAQFDSYTAAAKINQRKPHIMVDLDGHFRNSRYLRVNCSRVPWNTLISFFIM